MFSEPFHYSIYAPEIYIIFLVVCAIAYFAKQPYLYIIAVIMLFIIFVFYRRNSDPIDDHNNVIVSPCQGKVLKILKDDKYLTIVVFLNVHNVHIQYFPYHGKIISQKHKEGEFHPAYMLEKTEFNERTETILATKYGDIHISQIAGLVARRIVSFHEVNAQVNKGEPMGLIKFGSQVRIKIPLANIMEVAAKEDMSIRIGEALCRMKY
jgi:phosphatidylserine decarboxylase